MSRSLRRSVIVCPADGSAGARAAVAQAAAVAKVRQAELHLLHVPRERGGGHRSGGGEQEVHPVIADAIRSTLEAVRGRGQHIPFRIKAQPGKPESAISAYARRHRAGLIVISAGYGGGGGLARGSLARVLGRSAPCPVLVVPATASGAKRAVRASFRQVVCAVDFTKVSVTALEAAAAFAPHRHGRMTLVHTIGDIARGMVFSGSEGARLAQEQARHGAAASRRLLRLVPHAVLKRYRVRPIVGSGRPYQLIVEVASEIEADLIVMGMPRRSRVDEWLGGSTSRAVLRRTRSPVLLVPA
jgi:nucleotide-binding universal stress UspA family protein